LEGTHNIYARVVRDGGENPANNKASKSLAVQDSDTEGPAISSVVVAEYNGDGDGIIGADEQVRVYWTLDDPSGIASTTLLVDGAPITPVIGLPSGNPTSANCYAFSGPRVAGSHTFRITATDADFTPKSSQSPASSQPDANFSVVPSEEISVFCNMTPLVDGQTAPVDFGTLMRGASAVWKVFTVRNDGEQALSLGALSVPPGFVVTAPNSSVLGPPTTFTITLPADTEGTFAGQVSLANSDGPESPDGRDEHLFDFPITGTVQARTWSGGGNDSDWATDANWVGGAATHAINSLVFPGGAARMTNTNGFPGDTAFAALKFSGGGYVISGNRIVLNGGITNSIPVGETNQLSLDVQFAAAATSVVTDGGGLTLSGAISASGTVVKTGSGTLNIPGMQNWGSGATLQTGGSSGGVLNMSSDPGRQATPSAVAQAPLNVVVRTASAGESSVLNLNSWNPAWTEPGAKYVDTYVIRSATVTAVGGSTGLIVLGQGNPNPTGTVGNGDIPPGANNSVLLQVYTAGTAPGNTPTHAQMESLWSQIQTGFYNVGGSNGITTNAPGASPSGTQRLAMLVRTDAKGAKYLGVVKDLAGDVNGDFNVNINDIVKMAQQLDRPASDFGWGKHTWWEGDLNGDGLVNINDIITAAQNLDKGPYNPAGGSGFAAAPAGALEPASSAPLTGGAAAAVSARSYAPVAGAVCATPAATVEGMRAPAVDAVWEGVARRNLVAADAWSAELACLCELERITSQRRGEKTDNSLPAAVEEVLATMGFMRPARGI
jgi:hypothetical protein